VQIPAGTAYRLVKVPYQPADLQRQLQQLGWDVKVTATAAPFYWEREAQVGKRPA
jgi:hypothetical protein